MNRRCKYAKIKFFLGEAYPEMEFSLVNSLVGDGIQKDKDMGINALAFDTLEDLLWIGE